MKKSLLLLTCVALTIATQAQISITSSTLTYTQDFNSLDTISSSPYNTALPTGWELAESGNNANSTYRGGDGSSNSGDTYSLGTAGSSERSLGGLASGSLLPAFGARFTNSTGSTIDGFAISYSGEQWRLGNASAHTDSLNFSYSTNASAVNDATATWTQVSSASFTSIVTSGSASGAIDGNTNNVAVNGTVSLSIPNGGTLTIRWNDPNIVGSDDALGIDDLTILFSTTNTVSYNPNITALSPADNSTNVPVSTNNLQITFDKNIAVGTGAIMITNETDQTTQTVTVPSSDVTVNGMVATIANVSLMTGKSYHVTFDSSAFDTAGYKCFGIYDTTAWNFSTPLAALTSLNETFDNSCPAGLPVGWSKYSVTGAQEWKCVTYGYNGTPALEMNGYSGGNNINEDWLITPELDLSAMSNSYIQFRGYKYYTGDDIHVLASNDYDGVSDPSSSSFTWNDLNIDFSNVDTNWNQFQGDVTAYKASNMYIAFKYTSSSTDGARWRIDDVLTTGTQSVATIKRSSLDLAVLGTASKNDVTLGFNVKAGTYQLAIYDLAGRKVFAEQMNLTSGTQQKTINGFNLANGMYMIKLDNGKEMGTAKMIVQQ